jgi:hypothetical protein
MDFSKLEAFFWGAAFSLPIRWQSAVPYPRGLAGLLGLGAAANSQTDLDDQTNIALVLGLRATGSAPETLPDCQHWQLKKIEKTALPHIFTPLEGSHILHTNACKYLTLIMCTSFETTLRPCIPLDPWLRSKKAQHRE